MAELKPCKCEDHDEDIYGTVNSEGKALYKCMCINCGRSTKEFPTEEQAIDAWNRRGVRV